MSSARSTAQAGQALGRYTLFSLIGRGGMAEVWKAKIHGAHNFQRVVVLKRILPHLCSDPSFVRMFTTEAMLSSRLSHPNIVQVFEFAEAEGELFLAMEFVNGVNLSDVVKQLADREEQMPVGMAVQVMQEICLALGYAHDLKDEDGHPLGIIHRDVSPSNVMLAFNGGVKLLDFGIAKALNKSDDHTRTGALKGKFGYMSPEAVDSEVDLDARTDIFAAGVVLHELLVGRRLFKGRDDLHTISLVRACKIDAPSVDRPDVPAELDRITMKALARDRDQRYQSAGALASDLSRLLEELRWDEQRTAAFLRAHDIEPLPEEVPDPEATATPDMAAKEAETVLARAVPASKTGRTGKTGKTGSKTSQTARVRRSARLRWVGVVAAALALAASGVYAWRASRRAADLQRTAGESPALPPTETVAPVPTIAAPRIEPLGPGEGAAENAAAANPATPSAASASSASEGGGSPPASAAAGEASEPTAKATPDEPAKPSTRADKPRSKPRKETHRKPERREPREVKPTLDLQRGDVLKQF